MASPFPFTAGQVLTAAQLNSIGEATAFTPSWNNFTPGNAVESWYYVQINELVVVAGATTLGSTSSVTGSIQLQPPVGSILVNGNCINGNLYLRDASPVTNNLGLSLAGGGVFSIVAQDASSTYLKFVSTSATVPHTWAASDVIGGTIIYELA